MPLQEQVLLEYRDGAWTETTFSVADSNVTASIDSPGIHALFVLVHPSDTPTEAIPESTYIRPTPATTTQPTPTKAGIELSTIACGLFVLFAIGRIRKHR